MSCFSYMNGSKAVKNNASIKELDSRKNATGEDEDSSGDLMSDEQLSGVHSFFLPLREKSKKKQRRKRSDSDREKAFGKEVNKSKEDKKLVHYVDQLKRVSAWPDEYDTSSGSETEQKCCMTCGALQQPRVLHVGSKKQTMFKDRSLHDLETWKEFDRAEETSAEISTRHDHARKQKESHRRECKHNADDILDAVGTRNGKIDGMFLCGAQSSVNSKHEAEFEAKDVLSNNLSLGIEILKSEYEVKFKKLRRLAQEAKGKYKTLEKEKKDVEEKLKQAEVKIHRLQKNHEENEIVNAKLRQELQQHMKEHNAKQETSKQMEEEESMKTRKTNREISSSKSQQEMLVSEKRTSSKVYYATETYGFESEAFCDFRITRKDDVAGNAEKSTMLCERLEKIESVISKLGNTAQESVERELKLEEEFSQVKLSMLGFASRFKNSLAHGATRNLTAMLPEVQTNDVDNSSRTASAKNTGTSKYIATLCEIGKALCSESKHIVATIANHNDVVEELRQFEDSVRETVRTQINGIRSLRDEIKECKKTLPLKSLLY